MTVVHGGWLAPSSLRASIGIMHLRRSSVMQAEPVNTAHRLCLPVSPLRNFGPNAGRVAPSGPDY